MARLQSLFGSSARWYLIIAWIAVALALSQALLPLFFIIYSGFIAGNPITSFKGLIKIWGDSRHVQATLNSFIIAVLVGAILAIASTIAALVFKWCNLTGHRLIYGVSIIPLLIPDYVFGVAGRVLFDPSIGILAEFVPKNLLIDRFSALSLIAIFTILKWLPVMIVVADSSILAMRQDELNQVSMDYSSFRKAARYVYFPQMKEVFFIIISLGFLIGFRQHEMAYELTSGGGGFTAELWSYWNYREMFEFSKSAGAAVESLLILILLLIIIQVIRIQAQKFSTDEF